MLSATLVTFHMNILLAAVTVTGMVQLNLPHSPTWNNMTTETKETLFGKIRYLKRHA